VYVCNCNGLREKDVLRVIDQGASTPKAVFNRCQSEAQCAKCVCEIRDMIKAQEYQSAIAAQ
jgi:bacterioferritin-associated ferredoxin